MPDRIGQDRLTAFAWLLHAAGLCVTIAVVVVAAALLFRPINDKSRLVADEIQSTTDYLKQKPELAGRHDKLQRTLTDRQKRHAELIARIPDAPRESEFLTQLTQLARSTGMAISRYNPGEAVEDRSHASLEIELKAQASYASICRFLTGLEELPRLCRVTKLSIIAPAPDSDAYPVDLTLQIFFTPKSEENNSEVSHG